MLSIPSAAGVANATAISTPIPFDILPPQTAWMIVLGLLIAVYATLALLHEAASVTPPERRHDVARTRRKPPERPRRPPVPPIRPKVA
jgi:hypothetical protein